MFPNHGLNIITIVLSQFYKYCQLLFAQVSFNDIWKKYACERNFLQVIKWLDNAHKVVRKWNKCISRYNVVFLVSCYGVKVQKQPSIDVVQKKCSAKTQQIYRRSPMQKCEFNKVAQLKFLHKSLFLGMSTSLDSTNIKFITMVLISVILVIIYCDCFYYY